jgi:hypothetical protein
MPPAPILYLPALEENFLLSILFGNIFSRNKKSTDSEKFFQKNS